MEKSEEINYNKINPSTNESTNIKTYNPVKYGNYNTDYKFDLNYNNKNYNFIIYLIIMFLCFNFWKSSCKWNFFTIHFNQKWITIHT